MVRLFGLRMSKGVEVHFGRLVCRRNTQLTKNLPDGILTFTILRMLGLIPSFSTAFCSLLIKGDLRWKECPRIMAGDRLILMTKRSYLVRPMPNKSPEP